MTATPADCPPPTSEETTHPGFAWLDKSACSSPKNQDSNGVAKHAPFFVDAGRVISEDVLRMCRECPVRRECIRHAYLAGPGMTPIGAGYFGGFSLGQRKNITLRQALAKASKDSAAQQGTLL